MEEFLKDEAQVFVMFSSWQVRSKTSMVDLPVVKEFPNDITDLPLEREVEFSIDLVRNTSLMLMAPYKMSPSKLGQLKNYKIWLKRILLDQVYRLRELRCC